VSESNKLVAAGTTYATPPNPRVVIRVSEEFVSSTTPPLPPYPALPGTGGPTKPATPDQPRKPAATLERPQPNPGAAPAPEHPAEPPPSPARAGVELMPPRVTPGAVAPSENFVREEPRGPNTPRPAIIPGPSGPPPVPVPVPVPGPTSSWQPPSTQIPFCQVSNQKLENFALYDVNGQPWEFRRNNHARLILLDFWGTWCPPCRAAIPHLVQVQRQYGQQGLDVIGIAYEEGTPEEQSRKVKAMRDRMGINYRLLLGADADRCPVKAEMRVAGFPTLILLDEYGHMLCNGGPRSCEGPPARRWCAALGGVIWVQ
jgi:thiol-disulfide isomerase/thioredoxin